MFIMNFSVFFISIRLSSSSIDLRHHHRSTTQLKKPERSIYGRNQAFSDGIADSFLVSSALSLSQHGTKKSINQATIDFLTSLDVPKFLPPSTKRYVSSFKTLVHATNHKQTQRLNYINDSVMIFKLSKERKQQKSNIFNFLFKLNRCK